VQAIDRTLSKRKFSNLLQADFERLGVLIASRAIKGAQMLFFKRVVVIFASVCSIVACSASAFAENETECASSLHFSRGAAPISVDAQSDPLSPPDLVSNRDDTSDAAGSGAADLRGNLVECAVASNDAPSSVELTAPPGPRTLKRASEVRNWLLTGFVSKHFSQDSQLEDYNAGVFFEHDFDRRWGAIVGEYRNSGNIQSRMLAALWQRFTGRRPKRLRSIEPRSRRRGCFTVFLSRDPPLHRKTHLRSTGDQNGRCGLFPAGRRQSRRLVDASVCNARSERSRR
jgi:hypothetical protein